MNTNTAEKSEAGPTERPRAESEFVLAGTLRDRESPAWLKLLLGLTGLSVFIGLGKLFATYVLGVRRQGEFAVGQDGVHLKETRRMVGREVRSSVERFAKADVLSVRMETRYAYLPSLAGLTCLGLGVIVGLLLILDGIQGEFTGWILTGVGILTLGVVLDLVLTTVATSLPGQTTIILHLPANRTLRLVGCETRAAQRLVGWIGRASAGA